MIDLLIVARWGILVGLTFQRNEALVSLLTNPRIAKRFSVARPSIVRIPIVLRSLIKSDSDAEQPDRFHTLHANITLDATNTSATSETFALAKCDTVNLYETSSTNVSSFKKEFEIERHDNIEPTKFSPLAVAKFVAPTIALWIAPPVMSLIDSSVVGRYCGATELAALGPACTLIDSSAYLFMFIATATTNLVATSLANNNFDQADQVYSEALVIAAICGAFLTATVCLVGRNLLHAIAGGASANVVPAAFTYSIIRAIGQPAVIMASVARAAALASKDTNGPLLSVTTAFLLNAIGTWSLVRLAGWGIAGAAVATLVADCTAAIFLMTRAYRQRLARGGVTSLLLIPSIANLRQFSVYAAPIFFTILGKSVVYNGVSVAVGRLGSLALAAHEVLLRSFFFWTPVGDSVGMTSQVFLPNILAEEKRTGAPHVGAKRTLFATGLLAGGIAATLAGLLPSRGGQWFTSNLSVLESLSRLAPFLSASVLLHATALTCEGLLLAQRDLTFLSRSYVLTTILTVTALSSPWRPTSLAGFWWILTSFQGIRALQFSLRTLLLHRQSRETVAS